MKRVSFLVLIALSLLWSSTSFSQTIITGAVTGTVTDPAGAVVAGAPIVLRNVETGSIHNVKTNGAGSYRFDLIEPGNYTLTINQTGFATEISPVTVSNDQVASANFKLRVAGNNQSIDVTAQSPLQVEDGNVSTTVTQTQIEEIPNSGNNMQYVTRIVPGYNISTGFGGGTALYTVDGMLNNDAYGNSPDTGANNLMLGLSEVKEATVSGSPYSGQAGGLVGPQVNFVTKGGTNRVHGDINYWWTGRALIANSWFNKDVANPANITPRSPVHATQYSADIGFPVIRDRLFLYADTEGIRLVIPTSTRVIVPSQAFQQATIANLNAKGLSNSVPFYQKLFALYNGASGISRALPGNGSSATGCPTVAAELIELPAGIVCTNYFQSNVANNSNEWLVNVRGDFVINAHDSGFARVGADLGLQPSSTSQINPIFNTVSWQPLHSGQLNETHLFGSRAINSFLATGYWYQSLFGPADIPATLAVFPASISLGDSTFTGTGTSSTKGRIVSSGQVEDNVSMFLGRHTLKFGGRLYKSKVSDYAFLSGNVPTISPATLTAFYNGGVDPSTGSQTTFTQAFSSTNSYPISYFQLGVYVEDDWKIRSNFTLTGALRVDVQSDISCLKNCITSAVAPFPDLNHSSSVPYNQALSFNNRSSFPGGLQGTSWEPRIGFAYTPPIAHGSFVLRGGIGAFVDRLPGSITDSISANPPDHPSFTVSGDNLAQTETANLFNDASALNTAFSGGITNGGTLASIKASLPPALQKFVSPPNLYNVQNNLKIYEIYKWNFEVQKSLPKDIVLSANYLGDRGNHNRLTNAGLNAYSSTVGGLPTTVPDARFGTVSYLFSGGNSSYEAVIVQATKRFHSGGIFNVGYTFSNSLSSYATPGDPYHPVAIYDAAATDIRHSLVLSYVYKLPFKNIFYGGWEVSGTAFASSGLPFWVTDSATASALGSNNYTGVLFDNYSGVGQASCSNGHSQCLTRAQFSLATSVTPKQPVPVFRGPDYIDTDFSLIKTIPLHWEGGKFSFGVQAYNILNHPNFSNPNTTNISSSTFGTITATRNSAGIFSGVSGDDSPRILQVKGKISF
ncbi:MAG: carboxypeptidase-like regulatory domain-containing protein [Edaphobacter sp.]